MSMIWEGVCQECGERNVEFFSNKADRDNPRRHCDVDPESSCEGLIERNCFPSSFAVKWKYGKHDKEGCFMGPSKNVYKTDTTEKSRISKTRTVSGPGYSGPSLKRGPQ